MRDLTNEILQLIRRTSSSLPKDVEDRLRASIEKEEPGSVARGAATFLAQTVRKVLAVYKLEVCGVPEAMWVIEVRSFPVVVTMDSHGESKHILLEESSGKVLQDLLLRPY